MDRGGIIFGRVFQLGLFFWCSISSADALGASNASASSIPLFQYDTILELEMRMPFEKVKNGGKEDRFAGTVTPLENGPSAPIRVEFSARGNSRRVLCRDFPPFKINLPKKGLKGTIFANADDDLKFVPQCDLQPDHPATDDVTTREYTLYRVLAAAGLPALKVRLAHVRYLDETGREITRGLGFFIESVKDFAVRTKGERESRPRRSPLQLKGTVAVSQALVKNSDWWIHQDPEQSQNVKAVLDATGAVVEYVPYDFDLSVFARSSQHARWWDDAEVLRKATSKGFDGAQALLTVLERESAIRDTFENGYLNEEARDHFRLYYDLFFTQARERAAELEG